MHQRAHCHDEAANHQLPTAVAQTLLEKQIVFSNHLETIQIVSSEECSSLMQYLMQIPCSIHSIILNVMATQYRCSSKASTTPTGQYSELLLFTHAHSSPLSLAARLRRCHANHSCYVHNSRTFSGQTWYVHIYISFKYCNDIAYHTFSAYYFGFHRKTKADVPSHSITCILHRGALGTQK